MDVSIYTILVVVVLFYLILQINLVISHTTMASALHILDLEIASSLRRQRVFRDRLKPLDEYSDRAVALQFLTTGTFQTVVAFAHGISQTSLSRCVTAVCVGLASIASRYIQFPSESRQRVFQELFLQHGGFPLAFGCIDGSHAAINAPASNEEVYVNRKLFHSIYMQA